MHLHSDTVGYLFMPPQHVAVVTASPWSISYPVQREGFSPLDMHNEIRDITATLLSEVCLDVAIEPHLQALSGEAFPHVTANIQDGARLDIVASGFWGGRFERTCHERFGTPRKWTPQYRYS